MLFDALSEIRKMPKTTSSQTKQDLNKETVRFLSTISYARVKGFYLKFLLAYKVLKSSFYLIKDNYISKPKKPELTTELKQLPDNNPASGSEISYSCFLFVDFMGYARKILVKKRNLKTFLDMFKAL